MSFLFGGGRPQPSSAEKIAAAEAEIEMVSDMFNRYVLVYECTIPCPYFCKSLSKRADLILRLTQSCAKKCIPADYREADLNKGESVCLDRCVSKFFEVNMKVSEKMQNDAAGRQGMGAGGMGFGM